MALPIPPSVISLCTEAYTRCGVTAPTAAQLARAENEWFEEVKRDVASRKRWHIDEETLIVIPEAFLQVYAMPPPLMEIQRMRFYRGTKTGIAIAGGANTIVIATATGDPQDRGRKIFLLSGTGAAQAGRIIAVSADNYTISCNWETPPNSSTAYMIAEIERHIEGPTHILRLDGQGPGTEIERWDFVEHNIRFWPALDDAGQYALEIDGVVDVSLVDRIDPRLVQLLLEWREPLVRGMMVRMKEDQDDADADRDERKYEKAIANVMRQDQRKRLRGEANMIKSVGGMVRRRIR